MLAGMLTTLETLEARIRQVADLCTRLRSENQALRQQVAALSQENRQLTARLETAAARLDSLIDHLPEDP